MSGMSGVTIVMADPPARAVDALAAAGHEVVQTDTEFGRVPNSAAVVLWGAGEAGGAALRAAAVRGGIAGVIAVAPHVDPLAAALTELRARPSAALGRAGELLAVARGPRPVRDAARIACPVLIQVADEDDANPPSAAMKAAWNAGADVRHYPCDEAELLSTDTFALALEHQLVFLRHRM